MSLGSVILVLAQVKQWHWQTESGAKLQRAETKLEQEQGTEPRIGAGSRDVKKMQQTENRWNNAGHCSCRFCVFICLFFFLLFPFCGQVGEAL